MRQLIVCMFVAPMLALAGCDSLISTMHGGNSSPPAAPTIADAAQAPAPAAPVSDQAQLVQVQARGVAAAAPAAEARAARYTIDTPLGELTSNAQARAVVDRYAPGITEGPHAAMAASYSLRQIQAQMPAMISEAELNQMATELAAIR
jgi:hypothetical protein